MSSYELIRNRIREAKKLFNDLFKLFKQGAERNWNELGQEPASIMNYFWPAFAVGACSFLLFGPMGLLAGLFVGAWLSPYIYCAMGGFAEMFKYFQVEPHDTSSAKVAATDTVNNAYKTSVVPRQGGNAKKYDSDEVDDVELNEIDSTPPQSPVI